MPIIGFNFDRIIVERLDKIKKGMKIKSDLSIKSLEKEELDVGTAGNVIKVNFDFSVSYDPNMGNISLQGHVLFMEDQAKIDMILNEWEKSKGLEKEIAPILLNTILARCNIKALAMTQEVNLPPHIRLPMVKPGTKK
ncbi:hypothetical protein HOA59_01520 [archaeon]|jgi:hypothetical protein|nr:hypothetical protein [archaeon]MBT6824094.1 hypothetical protein [archaeon]MBT7107061.1 hypothetical protein [archaeon]MBT7297673.1 hypothetical protein [archaeon]